MSGKKGMRWAKRTLNPDALERIRNNMEAMKIVNQLKKCVFGEVEMAPHQVTAALGLLRKVVPDLQSMELAGDPERPLEIDLGAIISKLVPELAAADSNGEAAEPHIH